MRVRTPQTAAVIIDVQERLYPHMSGAQTLADRIVLLIRGLHLLEVPLLVTQQYSRGLGATVPAVAQALREAGVVSDPVEKVCFSCMDSDQFRRRLTEMDRRQVILAGVEAHVCVAQTAMDLLASGLTPVLVEDCVSSRRELDKTVALRRLADAGAVVTTAEALLFELCEKAGTDTFRALSRLVK